MPLVPLILEQGFLDMVRNPPGSPQEAAQRMSRIYADYAKYATSGAPATFTGLEAKQMENQLVGGFRNPKAGNPARGGGGIIGGIQAFWLTPPVVFGPRVATVFTGAPVLGSCLSASFTNLRIPHGLAAKKLANCLHAATQLVFTTGPPPPLLPVV